MADRMYRGTSIEDANDEEFATGAIQGFEANIFRGRLEPPLRVVDMHRGQPVSRIPWWTPEGFDDQPYIHETQGVTGGLTINLGTAITFAGGGRGDIPLVLYLSGVDGARVRYTYDWFNDMPGALAQVQGPNVDGEVRTEEHGLVATTSERRGDHVVWSWWQDIKNTIQGFQTEHEAIALTDSIDISRSVDAMATFFQSEKRPRQLLATQPGYRTEYGSGSGQDVTGMDQREAVQELYAVATDRAAWPMDNYWIVVLNSQIFEHVWEIDEDTFEYAYDGSTIYEDPDRLPEYLLGG